MEQITGMAWVTGYEGGPPIIPGGPVDPMVGAHAALAIVAALAHRDRTGEGQLVEVPLLEVATAVTAEQVIGYAIDGQAVRPARAPTACTACRATTRGSRSTSASDPMPADERAAWCETRTADDAVAELRAAGIPAAAMVPGVRDARRPAAAGAGLLRADRAPGGRARTSTRRGRCACRPGPRATGADRRRRSGSTPTTCCATSSA